MNESHTGGASFHRGDIDGLRAVAVGLVVLYHAGLNTVSGGFVGVDVFFVISGFLITNLLIDEYERSGRVSLVGFIARRARRLLPLAGFVLLTVALLGTFLLPPLQRPSLFGDIRAAALFSANWHFADGAMAYADISPTDSLVNHWWSLAIEEQFYFVWPLLIVVIGLVTAQRRIRLRSALSVFLAVVCAVSLWFSNVSTAGESQSAYYLTRTRLWELASGALVATLIDRPRRVTRRLQGPANQGLAIVGLAAILSASFMFNDDTAFPGSAALVPVLGTIAVLVSGTGSSTWVSWVLQRRPMIRVGKWSYALYLWHWPIIGFGLIAGNRWGWNVGDGTIAAGAVLVSLGVSAASHRFFENPIRYSNWLVDMRRRSLLAGAFSVAVPFVAVVTMQVGVDIGRTRVVLPNGSVTMTPREALDDRTDFGKASACNAGFLKVSLGKECIFGDPSGRIDVVLIGDSHAQHWLPALDRLGKQQSWRIHALTKSACPSFDLPVYNTYLKRQFHECTTWHEAARQRIASIPNAVVIMANMSYYLESLLDEEGKRIDDKSEAERRWALAASEQIPRVLETARIIVRLTDTPWPGGNVPMCLSSKGVRPSSCTFDVSKRSHLDWRLVEAEMDEVDTLGLHDRYVRVDPTDMVCPSDPCTVVTERGVIKYRDSHHLTQTFSRRLAAQLGELLIPLVDTPQ